MVTPQADPEPSRAALEWHQARLSAKQVTLALHKAPKVRKKAQPWLMKLRLDVKTLPTLARKLQVLEKKSEREALRLREIRKVAQVLCVRVPVMVEVQAAHSPRAMKLLRKVLEIDPRSDEGLLQRWFWLEMAWAITDKLIATRPVPGRPLECMGCHLRQARALFRRLPRTHQQVKQTRQQAAQAREKLRALVRQVERRVRRLRAALAAGAPA